MLRSKWSGLELQASMNAERTRRSFGKSLRSKVQTAWSGRESNPRPHFGFSRNATRAPLVFFVFSSGFHCHTLSRLVLVVQRPLQRTEPTHYLYYNTLDSTMNHVQSSEGRKRPTEFFQGSIDSEPMVHPKTRGWLACPNMYSRCCTLVLMTCQRRKSLSRSGSSKAICTLNLDLSSVYRAVYTGLQYVIQGSYIAYSPCPSKLKDMCSPVAAPSFRVFSIKHSSRTAVSLHVIPESRNI